MLEPGIWDFVSSGFEAQQTDAVPPTTGHGNLFEPADEKEGYGTHGVFDDREHASSP
ncbi:MULTISPECIES: hypothetical protein [unclassified Streptomyces]|uniref:hypothetical protein n=1 Tax=unclassified Streptomyces TaxID=2593676 RepID=UPI00163D4900|nr:hypothetical protein [Streptomyces sp. IB201691-2A2]